jgi:hypothetical protein
MAREMAWGWVRFQPTSTLTQWDQARFGQGSTRVRQIGMVALARKVLIVLWRFLDTGVLPAGAVLKTEPYVESVLEGAKVCRTGVKVLRWCGSLVAGHGFAWRTDSEEGLPTLGFTGAESACRIGCLIQRGQHG